MSLKLRALVLLRDDGTRVLARRFATVEEEYRAQYGLELDEEGSASGSTSRPPRPLGSLSTLAEGVLDAVQNWSQQDPATSYGPVTAINGIWPVVIVQTRSLIGAAVPLVGKGARVGKITAEPSISAAVSLLDDLIALASQTNPASRQKLFAMSCISVPFGRPLDSSADNTSAILARADEAAVPQAEDALRPAWRPFEPEGKNRIELSIREEYSSVQYGRDNLRDQLTISGRIVAKTNVRGCSEIGFNLGQPANLTNITLHKSVSFSQGRASVSPLPCGAFSVLRYEVVPEDKRRALVRGIYQMKAESEHEAKVLLQIRVAEPNVSFEYLELHLPFPGARITRIDANPTHGSAVIRPDKVALVWSVGKRVSNKSKEASLPATIFFDKKFSRDDPQNFYRGTNVYADVLFAVRDWTPSGTKISPREISVFPATVNAKTSVSLETSTSGHYRVWNSLAEQVQRVYQPPFEPAP